MSNQEFFATLTDAQRVTVLADRNETLQALSSNGETINTEIIETAFNQALMAFGWA